MTSRTKAIASLSGVFLLGAICGALILGIIVRDRVQQAQRLRDPEGFEQFIVDRLRLTEAQRDSIQDELDRTYAELAGLRHSTADEYRELLDTLKARIAPQLTPEQRELLAEMNLRFRSSFPKGRPPRPPHHGAMPPVDIPRELSPMPPAPGDTSPAPGNQKPPVQRPAARHQAGASDSSSGSHESLSSPDEGEQLVRSGFAEQLRDSLVLTSEQYQQIRQIIAETRNRVQRARADLADDPRMLRMAMHRNMREMNMRFVDVLTPEQLPKYRELRRQFGRSMKGGMRDGRPR